MREQRKKYTILYCEGLIRSEHKNIISEIICSSNRYSVVSIIDSYSNKQNTGFLNKELNIEIKAYSDIETCIKELNVIGIKIENFVIGIIDVYQEIDNKMMRNLMLFLLKCQNETRK